MKIQKLNWAGLKLSVAGKIILIDAVEDFSYYFPVIGAPTQTPIAFAEENSADYVLFTHLHLDHFDVGTIKKCLKPEGKIIFCSELLPRVRKHFDSQIMVSLDLDEALAESGIHFKPVFAMDGIGDVQCSWIVEGDGVRIFHGGDTIWHNQFWRLGKENEGIDYAFLPANGVVVHFPMIGLDYSPVPASLNIREAFAAARLLKAKSLVPIHYGLFVHPEYYVPQEFTEQTLEAFSTEMRQPYSLLNDGAFLT